MSGAPTEPVICVTAMPTDANAYGDILGGWLLSLMDSGAGADRGASFEGADGAQLMQAFKDLIEMPLGLVA